MRARAGLRTGFGLTLGLGLALQLLPGVAAFAADDPVQILSRSLTAEETFVGEQITIPARVTRPGKLRPQKVYRKGGVIRTEFANGQILFDDGSQMLLYLPRQGMVEKSPSPRSPKNLTAQRRALLKRRSEVTLLPDDQVAGRDTWVITAKPPRGASRKVWVDKQTYIQLRQDVTQPNGRTFSTYFTRIAYGQEPPAEKLAFAPPAGTQVVERGHGRPVPQAVATRLAQQGWGNLLQPRTIPAGYRFSGFYRHNFKGRPFLVSLYEGPGGNTVSLFQGPAMGMGGMAQNKRNVRVVTARKGNADVIVVGPLAQDELQRMMDSVE